jgi:hypothetical protein
MYIFVNNIWFTKDNDSYWEDPGYINFSISWLRSNRPDNFMPSNGVCNGEPSPTNVYQGTLGDFRIVLDTCNGLWGQEVQIGSNGETVTFGGPGRETDLNSLIVTRVRSPWLNTAGYIYDYDNIGSNSLNINGIYGGINNELTERNHCASSVISGRTTYGAPDDGEEGFLSGEIIAEVRAKFHGGATGGFDTKFQPKTSGAEGMCTTDSSWIIDYAPNQDWDDSQLTCFATPENAFPNKCGYWDGTFGMGGQCDPSEGCGQGYGSTSSSNFNNDFEQTWGSAQNYSSDPSSGNTDWDGVGHWWIPNPSYDCALVPPLDNGICQTCWPGVVPPRPHCNKNGYCQRGYGYDDDTSAWQCGGLTEPNHHEYCLSTYCSDANNPSGNESLLCPSSVFSSNQLTMDNLFNEAFLDKYYNRIRYNDCRQGNYDCISNDTERECSNPHNAGESEGWCYEFDHPWGSSSSTTWPQSGVGYPNEFFKFNIVDDELCLPENISNNNYDSVCATYFHTFVDDSSGSYDAQQIGNWSWVETQWNTRGNYKDDSYNCSGGQCELLNFEQISDNMFGCTDESACNYCETCIEHLQESCDYGEYYCPILGDNGDVYGCRPCESELISMGIYDDYIQNNNTNEWGTVPGEDCCSDEALCQPQKACQNPGSDDWSRSCFDIDPSCGSNEYDDCGVCCGVNTNNTTCDPDYNKDCNGVCLGAGFLDECGDCVTTGIQEQAYRDSCIGGHIWSQADQDAAGLDCAVGDGGIDGNCCCGVRVVGASSEYTGCDEPRPKFYYYDCDDDGKPCEGGVDYVLSCGDAPVVINPEPECSEAQYVEGPAPAAVNQNDWNNRICSDGDPCDWADAGWDLLCTCSSDYIDVCGVCGGDGSSCEDCAGDSNGSAMIDSCNNCIKCCTPEEETFCNDYTDLLNRPDCCSKLSNRCTNPIFDSSSCMHTGNDPNNQVSNGNYPEEEIPGNVGAPGGTCEGEGWFTDASHIWDNKYCSCFNWAATDCGSHFGSNSSNACSNMQDAESITGWDYKAWLNRVYDNEWWDINDFCTGGSNVCGDTNRVVNSTRQIYNTNNVIVGTYDFDYTSSGPGALENNYHPSGNALGDERFAGYCGDWTGAADMIGTGQNGGYSGTGGRGKIQSVGSNQFNPQNYEPSLKSTWSNYAKSNQVGPCYYSLTNDCSSNFNMERSCNNKIGRCGVCAGGAYGLETPNTNAWLDDCELCGGDGSTCGGGATSCNNNCWGTSPGGGSDNSGGGSYIEGADCDCSSLCPYYRDCCDHAWRDCAIPASLGQIGFGDPASTGQCMSLNTSDGVCADCDSAYAYGYNLDNNSMTYQWSSGNLINPTIKSCSNGSWGTGWYMGYGGAGLIGDSHPPDTFCEMVAAAGFVYGGDTGGSYGDFYDMDLSASMDGLWCGDWGTGDTCLKQKAPWYYCAVETCCQNIWNETGGSKYCLHYGGVEQYGYGQDCDWCDEPGFQPINGGGSGWYRGQYTDYYQHNPYNGNQYGPYIPQELVDAGLMSDNSHCPVL